MTTTECVRELKIIVLEKKARECIVYRKLNYGGGGVDVVAHRVGTYFPAQPMS